MYTAADLIRTLIGMGLSQIEIHRRTQIPQPRLSRWLNKGVPDSVNDALKLQELVVNMRKGRRNQANNGG